MAIKITNPNEDRYQRLRLMRWWQQDKLNESQLLVVGAGALGNEVVKNLALLGAGHVWIVDFDTVELTNLTRSPLFRPGDVGASKTLVLAARAAEMNPDCCMEALHADARYDLGLNFIRSMDAVLCCLDNREARYYINRCCYLLRKPLLDGGLESLNGSVSVFHPPQTACYECTLNQTDRAELQKRISCLKSPDPEMKNQVPTAPTIASIIAGLQVQIAVRYLHGLQIPAGKRIGLYGLTDLFFEYKMEVSQNCGMHSAVDPLPNKIEWLNLTADEPLSKVLSMAQNSWNSDRLTWDFDRDLVISLTCTSCGTEKEFVGTQSSYGGPMTCSCGGAYKPTIATEYSGTEPWGVQSFHALGFPANHIYCAASGENRIYFRLSD
jgi:molybdopterin/thiamine biosynthesis adenylyltransferase